MPNVELSYVSDWHENQALAEAQCLEAIEDLVETKTAEIEAEGGRVVGSTNYGMKFEYKDEDNDGKPDAFLCSTSTFLEWVDLDTD